MDQKSIKRTPPPRYDDAFRTGAICLVTEQHQPAKDAAMDLGICVETLRNRLKAAGVHPGRAKRDNRDLRCLRELEAENASLSYIGGFYNPVRLHLSIGWRSSNYSVTPHPYSTRIRRFIPLFSVSYCLFIWKWRSSCINA